MAMYKKKIENIMYRVIRLEWDILNAGKILCIVHNVYTVI